jgi:hypothetical protein
MLKFVTWDSIVREDLHSEGEHDIYPCEPQYSWAAHCNVNAVFFVNAYLAGLTRIYSLAVVVSEIPKLEKEIHTRMKLIAVALYSPL